MKIRVGIVIVFMGSFIGGFAAQLFLASIKTAVAGMRFQRIVVAATDFAEGIG
jgi:hypothetical protein